MIRHRPLLSLLTASALGPAACATDDTATAVPDRDRARAALEQTSGAPVKLEASEAGGARVITMTPRFPVATRIADPVAAARSFVAAHHDAFALPASDATSFVVSRVDVEPKLNLSHVTLQRVYDGIPVFQGAVTVHMTGSNSVFRAMSNEFVRVDPPTNKMMLSPSDAAIAAGKALGLTLAPTLVATDGQATTFTSPTTLDPIKVEPRIFEVAPGDDRFAYQALVSWIDDHKQLQYELAVVDALDGTLLADYSLVDTFTGRVYTASPGVNPLTDDRAVVSFDGDPAVSPIGWVDSTRQTRGNNAIAATDLNANNAIGTNEIQPTADANDSFDFPFSPLQSASNFREASVANAFYLVNDYHDRTYRLGFTEASGNFQTSNFGLGGAQNDEVQVDAQDGAGTNNANFATPPDGSKPRMQMFLFTITGGPQEDGDLDGTVIYHENTHGLSNRLVGGGATTCLRGTQSGGMGEGWSDFYAASFLNDPVIGAYVTGNASIGIRRASMAASPFTYANMKDGTLTEVHDGGEIWAAALWAVRKSLGAEVTEQIVTTGLKLTPCNPSMISARDAIIQADANINGGANRCKLWKAFASRQMGLGASSPNQNSTTAIVLSTAIPDDCVTQDGVSRTFTSLDIPKVIPDNSQTGVTSVIDVDTSDLDIVKLTVDYSITHTFRGDLVVQLIAPDGQVATLSNQIGGSIDNIVAADLDLTSLFAPGTVASGQWKLFVRDVAAADVGTINSFTIHLTSTN